MRKSLIIILSLLFLWGCSDKGKDKTMNRIEYSGNRLAINLDFDTGHPLVLPWHALCLEGNRRHDG